MHPAWSHVGQSTSVRWAIRYLSSCNTRWLGSSASHLWIIETGLPLGKLTPPLIITTNASPSATGPAPAERTWHRSDYARFRPAIRRSRHLMGGPYSPKAAEHQAKVDELAEAIEVSLDRAQSPAGQADRVGHRPQITADERQVAGLDGGVGAGAHASARSAWASAAASFTPSPTMATTRPLAFSRLTTSTLPAGSTWAITSSRESGLERRVQVADHAGLPCSGRGGQALGVPGVRDDPHLHGGG